MNTEEYLFDWMANKDAVFSAYHQYIKLTNVYVVTEPTVPDNVAPFRLKDALDPDWHGRNFPPSLSSVPNPTDTTVSTGEDIPTSGIWEGEWEQSPGLLKSLTGAAPRIEKGCMNYLLAGSIAPKYQDGLGESMIDVRWRLIWKDDRYLDGTIPEEEKEYLAEAVPETPRSASGRLRAERNELVPKTGWWHSIARPNGQALHYFEVGQHFPDWQYTKTGEVIWDFDPNQQPPPPKK